MPFKPKVVSNFLSDELNLLKAELEGTHLFNDRILLSTLIVYSALKSGVNNPTTISKSFYLTEMTVREQMKKLRPVMNRILNIRYSRKTLIKHDTINVTIFMTPEEVTFTSPYSPKDPNKEPIKKLSTTLIPPVELPIPTIPQLPTPKEEAKKPLSKLEKLRKLQQL